jgi:hypothetical protein
MGPSRGRRAIERGLVDMSIQPPAAETYSADRSSCKVESFYVDLLGEGRIFTSHWFDGEGRIADFVLVQEVRVEVPSDTGDEDWVEVVRVDCCHGEAHIHYFDSSGGEIQRRVLTVLMTRADVDSALDLAEDLVYERWEEHLGRWQRGY